ncbi:aminotransferase class IV [Kibdelosporangium persicum]|uniref:Integrase catalytic domain-containing protein n=1 Tax=Kibdelosporangium persicum TaxID=2698649 RepID=A0ABX2F4A5_9PSEU|nr:hypothetical protein [Kibdelosporangium persicum]
MIFHSDRGCQYTSGQYARLARDSGVRLSVGRKGQCWDNAVAESFFASIKTELLDRQAWPTKALVHKAIFEYVKGWYNNPPAAFQPWIPQPGRLRSGPGNCYRACGSLTTYRPCLSNRVNPTHGCVNPGHTLKPTFGTPQVRTAPPSSGPTGPLPLAVVEHEHVLPAVKHVGEVAKTYYLRQAVKQHFDDAAFIDRRGRLSEATIWNLAFWDGTAVVWHTSTSAPGSR